MDAEPVDGPGSAVGDVATLQWPECGGIVAGEGPGSAGRVALVWDDRVAAYDLGPGHPLAPIRVQLTMELIRQSGLLGPAVEETPPGEFDEADLLRLHRPDYVEVVKRLSRDPRAAAAERYGLGAGDTPAFEGMHTASVLVCAASQQAARSVWEGEADHAFNPAGGLHHAMPDRASGFCVYNDPAVAIDWLLEHGAERVAYVDTDVHHGDGVEVLFADDPRVLTISLHESGRYLFPGTGHVDFTGGPDARGTVANVPLHPGTTGDIWLGAFDTVAEPLIRAFDPDVMVTQLGCDSHATDPLAHLALTIDDMAELYARLHRLAHEAADGRWVATGGGGYQLLQVVPRAWTLAFAEMSGRPLPVETPVSWREYAHQRTEDVPPTAFTEDPVRVSEAMHEQARQTAEESVAALRRTVLRQHGVRS